MAAGAIKTVKDYRDSLAESMFHCALNQRLFCSSAADALVRPVKAYTMTSSCREKGTVVALESMLLEVFLNFAIWKIKKSNVVLYCVLMGGHPV
jgi:hypothetical protein